MHLIFSSKDQKRTLESAMGINWYKKWWREMPARFSNLDELPQWSPNNHGQSAQLERPAPPDAVGDQPTKQASNKCASQTHAHHKSCTRNRWPYTTKQIIITQNTKLWIQCRSPSANVFPVNPRSSEMLSSGSFTTLQRKISIQGTTSNKKKEKENHDPQHSPEMVSEQGGGYGSDTNVG